MSWLVCGLRSHRTAPRNAGAGPVGRSEGDRRTGSSGSGTGQGKTAHSTVGIPGPHANRNEFVLFVLVAPKKNPCTLPPGNCPGLPRNRRCRGGEECDTPCSHQPSRDLRADHTCKVTTGSNATELRLNRVTPGRRKFKLHSPCSRGIRLEWRQRGG